MSMEWVNNHRGPPWKKRFFVSSTDLCENQTPLHENFNTFSRIGSPTAENDILNLWEARGHSGVSLPASRNTKTNHVRLQVLSIKHPGANVRGGVRLFYPGSRVMAARNITNLDRYTFSPAQQINIEILTYIFYPLLTETMKQIHINGFRLNRKKVETLMNIILSVSMVLFWL